VGQLTLENRNGVAPEQYTLTGQANMYDASAHRCLESCHLGLAQSLAPVWAEAAMRRPGDGIFVDTDAGRKEPRDEIEAGIAGSARHA
jgi:hypothetical protein